MIDRLSYLNTNDELPEAIDNSLFSHIEDELSININDIINSDNMLLYDRYFFKCNVNSIEIFYPSIPINGEFPFRSPDYIRHILSVYADTNLEKYLKRIIFRPRYFSEEKSELSALFFKKEKILVEYLHQPCLYDIDSSEIGKKQNYTVETMENNHKLGKGIKTKSELLIPSTLYFLITSIKSTHNDIDKYFIKTDLSSDRTIEDNLNSISEFYKNHGY